MFKEICALISDRTHWDTPKIQVGHRVPSAPDRCALVSELGGGEPNFYLPDQVNLSIQVVTRAKTYFEARDDAWIVFWALHGTAGWDMPIVDSGPAYLGMVIEAMMTPQYIGQDENGRFEFSTNFIFRMREGSCGMKEPSYGS